ncbi:hypothetical protein VP01_1826g1 [Puccinia sorghi]|uniref:Uncharacterized protein n=1 Tax=Puccinia sorghi TaxID=27349 RepID=A0A0L6VFT8_9BASI|nr:hypothetical protein VP01_1826g1 [Puccinia sorghi]
MWIQFSLINNTSKNFMLLLMPTSQIISEGFQKIPGFSVMTCAVLWFYWAGKLSTTCMHAAPAKSISAERLLTSHHSPPNFPPAQLDILILVDKKIQVVLFPLMTPASQPSNTIFIIYFLYLFIFFFLFSFPSILCKNKHKKIMYKQIPKRELDDVWLNSICPGIKEQRAPASLRQESPQHHYYHPPYCYYYTNLKKEDMREKRRKKGKKWKNTMEDFEHRKKMRVVYLNEFGIPLWRSGKLTNTTTHPKSLLAAKAIEPSRYHLCQRRNRPAVNYQIPPLLGTPEIENLTGEYLSKKRDLWVFFNRREFLLRSSCCFKPTTLHPVSKEREMEIENEELEIRDKEARGKEEEKEEKEGEKKKKDMKEKDVKSNVRRAPETNAQKLTNDIGERGSNIQRRKREYEELLERVNWEFNKKKKNTDWIKAVFNDHQLIQEEKEKFLGLVTALKESWEEAEEKIKQGEIED